MFISRQRNSIFNINEFNRDKQQNINNSKNVDINNNFNTFKKMKFKMIKTIIFNENRMKFKN